MRGYLNRFLQMLPKLSTEEVKRVVCEFADENNMMDSILDSLSSGLVIVDNQWKVIQTNKAADRFLFSVGIDESKAEGQFLWDVISDNEIALFLKDCSDNCRSHAMQEFTTANADGSVRFLDISVMPLLKQSQISGNIIKIVDVTAQRKQEILLRRMENLAGLTNLAAGMAHEIKNPLGAISIHVQLVQKAISKKRKGDGTLPDKKFLEDHLDIINEEIENLNSKVMSFLLAVRPVKAELKLYDPLSVLQGLVDFITPEFSSRNVCVALKAPEKVPKLLIDEKLFRDVLLNIAQNAFAAITEKNQDSGKSGFIDFEILVSSDKCNIVIEDSGCGMSDETVSKIFEPYFTTKANGTGLGMTMAYKVIKEFGGDIQVSSKLGVGSRFVIVLPVPQTDRKMLSS